MLVERSNDLIESCRRSASREAALAVESFIVFFQTLVPTLRDEPAREVKATFFRLAPTLVHMAWDETAGEGEQTARRRGGAPGLLETILLEVSSVHLTPAESELLFKSLDQLATLLAAGEYALARDVVGAPLLAILRKNRVSRSLFRLMEVEVGDPGLPQGALRLLDPAAARAGGPRCACRSSARSGSSRTRSSAASAARYLQVQLPDIPILSDIVDATVARGRDDQRDLRLDGLGSTRFELPPGLYSLGLIYEPEESARGLTTGGQRPRLAPAGSTRRAAAPRSPRAAPRSRGVAGHEEDGGRSRSARGRRRA